MRILICTQIMDRKDSALGFFQKWVASLAPHFEHVEVICLKEGEHSMPFNVRVSSLGKEKLFQDTLAKNSAQTRFGAFLQRIRYSINFYKIIWQERNNYDAVFVHMNQEYILLGGLIWKLLGKKISMWRNHYDGSMLTDIAVMFCDKVFCTSKYSYTARFKKTIFMPVGVDEDSAHLDEYIERIPHSILFLGRLDTSKRPEVLIDALGLLAKRGVVFTATFVGGPSKKDSDYPKKLQTQVERLGISEQVKFVGAVPNTETYKYYRSHEVFINCSRSGMFDKTIFKAVVCGCFVLVTSRDFFELAGEGYIFEENNSEELAEKLQSFLGASSIERGRLLGVLKKCVKQHNLPSLVEKVVPEIKSMI